MLSSIDEIMQNNIMCHFGPSRETHTHDFYELTLVSKGQVAFFNNGADFVLSEGSLVIIRPGDIHRKTELHKNTHIISLGFAEEVLDNLFLFLGEGFDKEHLFRSEYSPTVTLSDYDIIYFKSKVDNIYHPFKRGESIASTELRIILMELVTRFLPLLRHPSVSRLPTWLQQAMDEMSRRENFIEGVSALVRTTQKSHAYLCRVFKSRFGITPTQYVNKLRLGYATQLLLNTSWDILTVAGECGFENLSHFYHCFSAVYGMSPKEYRTSHLTVYR